ncbi:MAG TPA: hypothetical protein VHM72_01310 [Solirubrobacteraceae bacterium]|jgi:hypothetical protein|nr:hypothetical protein [Solirubrobacteraceae bacterium]
MNATAVITRGPEHTTALQLEESIGAPCEDERGDRDPDGPQHMQALQRANLVRLARAEIKRRIAVGELAAADVVRSNSWEVQTMAVAELLMSQRRWGHTRARRFLAGIPMAETKTIGSMTTRQRDTLATLLSAAAAPGRPTAIPAAGRAAQAA